MLKSRQRSNKPTGSRTDDKRDKLAQAVRSWALEQMHLKDCFVPTLKDIKSLFMDAISLAVWDYMMKCIHSPSSAIIARKNLMLHLGCLSDEGAGLCARREGLVKELKSLNVAVSQMEVDIARLNADIEKLVHENDSIQHEVREASQRKTLFSAHSIKSQEGVRVLEEYTHRVAQRKECFSYSDKELSYFARAQDRKKETVASKGVILESACMRDVGEACELVKSLLTVGHAHTSSQDTDKTQAQVWTKIESLLNHHPPSSLIQCLCELADDEASSIHSYTASLDLSVEAANLRCKLDNSLSTKESSEENYFLKSVEDHLMEAQLSHIQRCVETERWRGEAELAQRGLKKLKEQFEELLWKQLPLDSDQEKRALMSAGFSQELEECSYGAMLVCMVSFCGALESAKTRSRETIANLQLKREHIHRFAEVSDEKQSQIKRLAKMNSAGREKLQKQRSELELYVKRNVCHHRSKLVTLGGGVINSGAAELKMFSGLDLDRACMTPGYKQPPRLSTPTCELSIHRLSPHQPSGYHGWAALLGLVHLPLHVSPHCLITHLTALLHKVDSLSSDLVHQNKLILRLKESAVDDHECKGVLEASFDYDNWLHDEGMNVASKSLSLASKSLARCATVQQTLQEWWEEPSQLSVPWINHGNMPFSKWLEQWRVLTSKLQQLSNN